MNGFATAQWQKHIIAQGISFVNNGAFLAFQGLAAAKPAILRINSGEWRVALFLNSINQGIVCRIQGFPNSFKLCRLNMLSTAFNFH